MKVLVMSRKFDTTENKLNASIHPAHSGARNSLPNLLERPVDGGSTGSGAAAVVTADDPTTPKTLETIMVESQHNYLYMDGRKNMMGIGRVHLSVIGRVRL